MTNISYKDQLLGVDEVAPFFHLLKENIARSRLAMTVVFLKNFPVSDSENNDLYLEIEQHAQHYFISKIRETDLLFKLNEPNQWGIILMQSGERDATAFLDRIFHEKNGNDPSFVTNYQYAFCAMVAEIKTNQVNFYELLDDTNEVFHENLSPWEVKINTKYNIPQRQNLKVSIIENNEIFRGILKSTIQKIQTKHFTLDIQDFVDGYDFIESGWHLSSHPHIVIMNDILPRKNGLEVLDTLRSLPNQKKFIIYMMTRRNSQTDIISAYESGVDEYLIKPFDLRLFKAQLLRTLERLQQ
ncbi:response regulator [Lysinibacillus sp. BW-2-10]|uniref:response regulator n=1 Tax=Lysinibacillus sp. BW-2-10 TaxID=2590030 RepID=UPI00118120B2|nr:response regulator [Lysinibacillus sp. BW-2-10]TSI11469.1 response regulator [Lysinibacillus sp. BW-2-10]